MPHLQFHEAGRSLFLHLLKPGRTVIGRSDTCDVALPSESVSRVHCVFEKRADGWWVHDRSRHGTRVNGAPVGSRLLIEGDRVGLGVYEARFSSREDGSPQTATATRPVLPATHEELVEISDTAFVAGRAVVRVTRGPRQGQTVVLQHTRTSFGGPGATLVLGPDLPRDAGALRVVRGRAMVEPGEAAVLLGGARVREITPVFPGEELHVGDAAFTLELTNVEESPTLDSFGDLVGQAEPMRRLFGLLARVAAHDAPVLLTGESGTGKELAAKAVHEASPRLDRPYVALNCAAIPDALLESELFGHERGAFTGADQRQDGAFQRAAGGTLFLDEVGELTPEAQAALLRALESGEVRRVGGRAAEFPDVRVVAATHRNLPAMVQAGTFRQDLYFRLAVLTVRMPALRERPSDIPLLARALLERHHPGALLTDPARTALQRYAWPGNVRELRNVLTRAVVLCGPHIGPGDLTFNAWSFDEAAPEPPTTAPPAGDDAERQALRDALRRAAGNRTHAANLLGIPRSSLLYKLKKHRLDDR